MQDLDGAMHTALRMSLEHVKEQGKTLHPDTLAALAMYEPELAQDEAANRWTPEE